MKCSLQYHFCTYQLNSSSFGADQITLHRSEAESDEFNVSQQINSISSYINSNNVYGSDDDRISALLAPDALQKDGKVKKGTGRMDTSEHNGFTLLPLNTALLENASDGSNADSELFLAGGMFRHFIVLNLIFSAYLHISSNNVPRLHKHT